MNSIITCPKCNKKAGEVEVKIGEYTKLYCEHCKEDIVIYGKLVIKKFMEYEKEKEEKP